MLRSMSARWPLRSSAAIAAGSLLATACTSSPPASSDPVSPGHSAVPGHSAATGAGPSPAAASTTLLVTPAPYQLPAPISREVVLPGAGGLTIAGGLNSQDGSTDAVTQLDPVTGATRALSKLPDATHDAAGAALGGRAFLFGGGTAASVPTVQVVGPGSGASVAGQLPAARSDASGVTIGATAYVVGGYDSASPDPRVLATADGKAFRVVARLPVPVRYAGVAEAGGDIWVFGGQTGTGTTDVIQRIDPATGRATVAGRLPQPVQGAAAISLDGRIYLAGGAGSPRRLPAGLSTSSPPPRPAFEWFLSCRRRSPMPGRR